MVTVVEYAIRQAKDGREFIALILQGGLCMVQSKQTGNFYGTVKRPVFPAPSTRKQQREWSGEDSWYCPETILWTVRFHHQRYWWDHSLGLPLGLCSWRSNHRRGYLWREPDVTMVKRKDPILLNPSINLVWKGGCQHRQPLSLYMYLW